MNSGSTTLRTYVQNNRTDLMFLLKHGDVTLRCLVICVLIEGGDDADISLLEKELEFAKRAPDFWR